MEVLNAIGTIIGSIIKSIRKILDPSVPFYSFYLPNADILLVAMPFLLFGSLFLAAFFATYISYQRIFFLPDNEKPLF